MYRSRVSYETKLERDEYGTRSLDGKAKRRHGEIAAERERGTKRKDRVISQRDEQRRKDRDGDEG